LVILQNKSGIVFIKQDPLTIKGYAKIFESCENISQTFDCVKSHYGDIDIKYWINTLIDTNRYDSSKNLINYFEDISSKFSSMNYDDCIKVIETISLLENVFRNVLLRPYIPAYRTINMNCGRYCCYIYSSAEELLKKIGFKNTTTNLLTYTETNPVITITYALTCSVLWHFFKLKLDKQIQLKTYTA
jgi:hypothetical protein